MKPGSALAVIVLLLCTVWPSAAQTPPDLPIVRVLATGGTIAGEQREPGTLSGYDVKRSAIDLVSAIPIVKEYARVETEQFANISSPSITPDHWLALAQRINELFAQRPDLSGIVVTHGTSRLEETAFFLHLTIKSDRPVVVVGAQRPATALSADGPLNLLSAVRVAAALEARGKGVMVVMDDRILSAREVTKEYARSGGFDGGEMGMLGSVGRGGVDFFYQPVKRHTLSSEFDVAKLQALPRVAISYWYAGAEGLSDPKAKAVIVATTGFAPEEITHYEGLRQKGVIVATTFPSGQHVENPSRSTSSPVPSVIAVKHLRPTKARILMMLALTRTESPALIQRIFDTY